MSKDTDLRRDVDGYVPQMQVPDLAEVPTGVVMETSLRSGSNPDQIHNPLAK
jgi:hypothetical protein